ncbi:hypothetical protein VMCG_10827 [Cytospora schulzeri]|uniref:Uncharacterized protein n=1 Tax=Cytospora schulzeri TaxID=448051 RepID=A0A423V8N6_9PEZI|nr:hypothetical protein VMCG_10827 [Valsa malicola]
MPPTLEVSSAAANQPLLMRQAVPLGQWRPQAVPDLSDATCPVAETSTRFEKQNIAELRPITPSNVSSPSPTAKPFPRIFSSPGKAEFDAEDSCSQRPKGEETRKKHICLMSPSPRWMPDWPSPSWPFSIEGRKSQGILFQRNVARRWARDGDDSTSALREPEGSDNIEVDLEDGRLGREISRGVQRCVAVVDGVSLHMIDRPLISHEVPRGWLAPQSMPKGIFQSPSRNPGRGMTGKAVKEAGMGQIRDEPEDLVAYLCPSWYEDIPNTTRPEEREGEDESVGGTDYPHPFGGLAMPQGKGRGATHARVLRSR